MKGLSLQFFYPSLCTDVGASTKPPNTYREPSVRLLKRSKLNLLIVTTNMSFVEEGLGEEGSKIPEDDGTSDLGECNMSVLIQVLKRKDDRSLKMKVRDALILPCVKSQRRQYNYTPAFFLPNQPLHPPSFYSGFHDPEESGRWQSKGHGVQANWARAF